MGSLCVKETGPDAPRSAPLPSKEELQKMLFGGFYGGQIELGHINMCEYQVREGVYEYEDNGSKPEQNYNDGNDENDIENFYKHGKTEYGRDVFETPHSLKPPFLESPFQREIDLEMDGNESDGFDEILQNQDEKEDYNRFQYMTDEESDNFEQPILFESPQVQQIYPEYCDNGLGTNPKMTTQENLKNYFRQRVNIPSGIPAGSSMSGTEKKPKTNPFIRVVNQLKEEGVNIDLMQESFSTCSLKGLLGLAFFAMTVIIGELLQAPMAFLTALWGFALFNLTHAAKSVFNDFNIFRKKRKYRQQLFQAKPDLQLWISKHTNDKPDIQPWQSLTEQGLGNPRLQGLKIQKPDGVISHNPRKKRILVEKLDMSKTECKLIDDRPYLPIRLAGGLEIMALVDTGASSTSIRPSLVEKLEKITPVARVKKDYEITGVVPGATTSGDEYALISFKVSTGYEIHNTPMIIADMGTDILIGANLIRSEQIGTKWKENRYFIEIGDDKRQIEAFFLPQSILTAVTVSSMVLMPNEKKIIPLRIPSLDGIKNSNFHKESLFASSLQGDSDQGIEITPCLTKIKRNKLLVEVVNKTNHPVACKEQLEMAQIQVLSATTNKESNIFDITKYRQTKYTFERIPRLTKGSPCYCHHKRNTGWVVIQIGDRYGMTSTTDNFVSSLPGFEAVFRSEQSVPLQILPPGPLIRKHGDPEDRKQCEAYYSIMIIPDEDGSFSSTTRESIRAVKNKLEKDWRDHYHDKGSPSYYFMDPLTEISYSTMKMMVDVYYNIGFCFYPVEYHIDHPDCVHFSMKNFPPELLAGAQATRLHIQQGHVPPPTHFLKKDKGTPLFKTHVLGATVFMFRLGIFLSCHLHLPGRIGLNRHCILWRDRIFYSVLNELRKLRVPTDFQITADGNPFCYSVQKEIGVYIRIMNSNLSRVPPFLEPNEKCSFPIQELAEEVVDLKAEKYCSCTYCTSTFPHTPDALVIFEGSLFKPKERSDICAPKTPEQRALAVISSFTAIDEAEFDTPLDPLGLVDEEELFTFMNTHPGFENEPNTKEIQVG